MSHRFILSPEIEQRFKEKPNLQKKITHVATHDDHWGLFHINMRDMIQAAILETKEKGYYNDIPSEIRKHVQTVLQAVFQQQERVKWTVQRPEGAAEAILEEDDALIVSGVFAAEILEPGDFSKYPEAGFHSYTDYIGTLGAAIMQEHDAATDKYMDKGYSWETKKDGRTYSTKIGASNHGDLRIMRTDRTWDETIDPFGLPVSYKPITSADRRGISPYHSTEPSLLAAALKYVQQEKIDIDFLHDGGKPLLEKARGLTQRFGNFADAGYGDSTPWIMGGFAAPIVEKGKRGDGCWGLGCESHGGYCINIDTNRDLMFTYSNEKGERNDRPSLVLLRDEIRHLIEGLFVQSSMGLGRTSIRQLCSIVEKRFSPEFIAENDKREREISALMNQHS